MNNKSQPKAFDEDVFPSAFGGQCEVFVNSQTYYSYDVFLDEEIREPSYYRQALKTIRDANEGDLVKIHLATPGGNLTSALMIISAIEECAGEVVAIVEGECYSGGSLIALSCPVIDVKPGALFMLHSASFGSSGSVQTVRDHVNFIGSHAEKVMEEVYKNFISDEEMEDLKRGRELWFDSKQISERLEKMFEDRLEDLGEQPTLESIVKNAVKEALAEMNPSIVNTINISPELNSELKDQFIKIKTSGEVGIINPGCSNGNLEGQVENGLSPETAYPYCPDSVLEKGVWYKWEAGQSCEFPFDAHGTILFGDGQVFEDEAFEDYDWSRHVRADDLINAFKLDK